jgi:hypothetical protein
MSNQSQDLAITVTLYVLLYGLLLSGYLATDPCPIQYYRARHWGMAFSSGLLWLMPVVVCHYILRCLHP